MQAGAADRLGEGMAKSSQLQPHSHLSLGVAGEVGRASMEIPVHWWWKLVW